MVSKTVEHYFEDLHDYSLALQRMGEMEAEGDEDISFEDVLGKKALFFA